MTSLTIAVHGATGAQGSPVVRHLVAGGHTVRAVARNPRALPEGAVPVAADVLDTAALAAAYADVDAVVLQLPLNFDDDATAQAQSVLTALGKAGVSRVVFNSNAAVPGPQIGVPFVDARALLWSELPNVVAQAALVAPAAVYAENIAAPWSSPLIAAGELRYPLPAEARTPWVAADDVAAVIAEQAVAATVNPVQLIAGPADLTGEEAAGEIAAALGKPVRWLTITAGEYEQMLLPHLGPKVAAGIASSYEAPKPPLDPAVIRRGTTTLRQWAATQQFTAQ